MAYFDERRRSNALIARTVALEETYEALVGNDGSLEGLTQNLFTSSSDLKARQDIICEQVCTISYFQKATNLPYGFDIYLVNVKIIRQVAQILWPSQKN